MADSRRPEGYPQDVQDRIRAMSEAETRHQDEVHRRARTAQFLSNASAGAAGLIAALTLASFTIDTRHLVERVTGRNDQQASAVAVLQNALDQERRRTRELEKQLAIARQSKNGGEGLLEARIAALEASQVKINAAILSTPEKALELPFLRRDLNELEAKQDQSVEGLRREQDRVWDLNKWLFGGLAVTVLGLALANALRPKDAREVPKVAE